MTRHGAELTLTGMAKSRSAHKAEKRKQETARRAAERVEAASKAPAPDSTHSWDFENLPGSQPMYIKITLAQLAEIARGVSDMPIVSVPIRADRDAQELFCIQNVERKTVRDGGRACYGWTFNQRFSVHGPYVYLQHHAVWQAPDAQLMDVTPRTSNPSVHPLTIQGRTLFLVDQAAVPTTDIRFGLAALPSRFFALREGESLRDYIVGLNAKELAAPHTLAPMRS